MTSILPRSNRFSSPRPRGTAPRPLTRRPARCWPRPSSALVLVGLMWEDVARNGPWTGLPGRSSWRDCRCRSAPAGCWPASAAALGAGAWLARRPALPPGGRGRPSRACRSSSRFDGRPRRRGRRRRVAAAKIPALLAAGADVTVVAPGSRRRSIARACASSSASSCPSDLDGAWFVTAAATPEVNRAVARGGRGARASS